MKNKIKLFALFGAGALLTTALVATTSLAASAASLTGFAPNAPSVANIPDGDICNSGSGRWIKFTAGGGAGLKLTATSGQPKATVMYDNITAGGDQTIRFYQFRYDGSSTDIAFSSVAIGISSANPVWTFPATDDTNNINPGPRPLLIVGNDKNFSQFAICSQDTAYLQITKNWAGGAKPDGYMPTYKVDCAPADSELTGTAFDFTGTEAVVEGKAFLAGLTCTISEVAVQNNGWLEDSAPKTFTFEAAQYGVNGGASAPEFKAITFTNTNWSATKAASGTKTNTYGWTLTKTANPTSVVLAVGGTADVTYTITPSRSGPVTVSSVAGAVTVSRSAGVFPAGSVTVLDPGALTCTGIGTASLVCDYSNPATEPGTNTATVTYKANGDIETLTPTKNFTMAVTNIDETATLKDVYDGGSAKTGLPTNAPTTYTKTFTCDKANESAVNLTTGQTRTVLNTATLDRSTSGALVASATVTASCGPLTATKTATATYTNAYDWTLTKTVDNASIALSQGATGTANYTVVATRTGPVKTNIKVSGSVTLTNKGLADVNVTGATDSMGALSVPLTGCKLPVTLAANGTPLTCTYDVNVPGGVVPTTNSVVFTTSGGPISAEQPVVMGAVATTGDKFTATDTFNGGGKTVLGEGTNTTTFKYSHSFTCGFATEGSERVANGATANFPNTATLSVGESSPKSASAAVNIGCGTPPTTTIIPPTSTLVRPLLVPPPAAPVPPVVPAPAPAAPPAAAAAVPAQVLAEKLAPPTIQAAVLGEQISQVTPAFTGANNGLIGVIGAMLLTLGGVFVVLASLRRRKSA